jgi:hypothetical protein
LVQLYPLPKEEGVIFYKINNAITNLFKNKKLNIDIDIAHNLTTDSKDLKVFIRNKKDFNNALTQALDNRQTQQALTNAIVKNMNI